MIKFTLVNKPFERRGTMARGGSRFRDERKSPKGGRGGEKVRFKIILFRKNKIFLTGDIKKPIIFCYSPKWLTMKPPAINNIILNFFYYLIGSLLAFNQNSVITNASVISSHIFWLKAKPIAHKINRTLIHLIHDILLYICLQVSPKLFLQQHLQNHHLYLRLLPLHPH